MGQDTSTAADGVIVPSSGDLGGEQRLPVFNSVESRWFSGTCSIKTYSLNELLGTKLRALFQRRKGRDLFDLATALKHAEADPVQIIETHGVYMEHEGRRIPRKEFEENLSAKLRDKTFIADIGPLLATGYQWNLDLMADTVLTQLIRRLPG